MLKWFKKKKSFPCINQIVAHHSASRGQSAENYAHYHTDLKGWQRIPLIYEKNTSKS